MGHIFGDTDDITFGGVPRPSSPDEDQFVFTPKSSSASSSSRSAPELKRSETPVRPSRPVESRRPTPSQPSPAPHHPPREIEGGLTKLIQSMKSSFFPQENGESIRMTLLSSGGHIDPMMVLRSSEGSLLIGTGFSPLTSSGKTYASFPDVRLPYSEKDRGMGWILLSPGFDIVSFQMILETLGFPHVYGTRDVIAYIRESIKETSFLDKCRFFEIFSPGVTDRKIGNFLLQDIPGGLALSVGDDTLFLPRQGSIGSSDQQNTLLQEDSGYSIGGVAFRSGEIIDISKNKINKQPLKFTFDTFYIDKNSIGVAAGYTLKDREILAENGVLTFVLEEDVRARAIVGHIFIDSRGFVHAQEMMTVHKEILKGIRHTYEQAILANERIERSELVHTLRRELTKYCYLITGRTPVVMPIIIER